MMTMTRIIKVTIVDLYLNLVSKRYGMVQSIFQYLELFRHVSPVSPPDNNFALPAEVFL